MFFITLLCLCLSISLTSANTEKAIFLGPEPVNIPAQSTSLAALNIDTLTPVNYSLRTHLDAIFPTEEYPRGKEAWLILDNLTESQRYEVRVCWLATVSSLSIPHSPHTQHAHYHSQQPTAFHLITYPLDTVFDTPELITSLYNYSMSRQSLSSSSSSSTPPKPANAPEHEASILFLRIFAAAEYFTTNATLMAYPEPVLVDIILDPFLGNVLPRTLAPTVVYIVVIAVASWILAWKLVVPGLKGLFGDDGDGVKKTQ